MSEQAILPDLLAPGLDVVFCGLNPGLGSAQRRQHFVNPSNRFWRVLHLAGFSAELLDAEHDARLLDYGCGLTTAVARPTVSAQSISAQEYRLAAQSLEQRIAHYAPRCLAFLGKAAYSAISGQGQLDWGEQAAHLGGARVWLLPNPSGLNRAFSLERLVQHYAALREALAGSAVS
ncbi:G/U mismatch-specific DNA glycosylase [Pseudomonas sp. CAN2814]|uniref:G/U mismatch-specific DNA glycosylase n=1 Tax=Pseudomonas sp. CAN1 TaxID=3046726 RepID=UPI002649BADC|nr:G/U mismatch-specific DNA glycosylase [Pseudomonas sp. CAN1]MDN6858979.1 G/U mismatch-specific DNA glycosylase [Pseudomonas sp. CAN1]